MEMGGEVNGKCNRFGVVEVASELVLTEDATTSSRHPAKLSWSLFEKRNELKPF